LIEPGQFVAVIGANGSGKTTFARHINAILKPRRGRVLVAGLDTTQPDLLFDIRSLAGMVLQNPNAQMVASVVADDVAFGPENLNVPSPELEQRVADALEAVGLSGMAESDPAQLSGGQRQRVSIAGILAMRPDIIVLDEPGAMLDVRGRDDVRSIVGQLNAAGMTVVLITHFMEEALAAERVLVMGLGRIILDGPPEQVFSEHETLRRLGLDVPFSMLLAEALAGRGLDVPLSASLGDLKELLCGSR
jgi:energy-coupling factor transport system ATP-binding protein